MSLTKKILIGVGVLFAGFLIWWFLIPVDYYEHDVVDASECLEGESFDEEYSVCYFDFSCETEKECEEIDAKYEKVLNALDGLSGKTQQSNHGEEVETKELASFDVEGGELFGEVEVFKESEGVVLKPEVSQEKEVNSAWEIMQTILPKDKLSQIVKYNEHTDGVDGELASVEPVGDGSTWVLFVDPKDAYNLKGGFKNKEELIATLVHEYAHILTLDNTQQEFTEEGCDYGQFETFEGCAYSDSYLSLFVEEFWSDYLDEFFEIEESGDEDDLYDFYLENESDFVTEYAATNPGEDIAESFVVFVTKDKSTGNSISDQKINFFYNYSELVELRGFMRGRITHLLDLQTLRLFD